MFNFKHLLARLLLAAAMLGACAQAAATPMYRVDINTASLGSGSAFLGLYFLGLAGAADTSATVSKLTGALDGAAQLSGAVSGSAPGRFVFSSANGGGELIQAIQLGGKFSFEVGFAIGGGSTGMTFGWALFDDTKYLGADGDLGNLMVQPDAPAGMQLALATPVSSLDRVIEIPEPSTTAVMLAAMLAALAWHRKGSRHF